MSFREGELRRPDDPAELPPSPSSVPHAVELIGRAVDRTPHAVRGVLRECMPRLSLRRNDLWVLLEAACLSVRYLTSPVWWHRPREERLYTVVVQQPPWDRLASGERWATVGVYAALGRDVAAAWWPGLVSYYDVNANWFIEAPAGVRPGERFAADDGEGNRAWCVAVPDEKDRLRGRILRDEEYPEGPYERLWPGQAEPYWTLEPALLLLPGEHTRAGDPRLFRTARAALATFAARVQRQGEATARLAEALEEAARMQGANEAAAVARLLRATYWWDVPELAAEGSRVARLVEDALDSCLP